VIGLSTVVLAFNHALWRADYASRVSLMALL
jgi:hypothetical protein